MASPAQQLSDTDITSHISDPCAFSSPAQGFSVSQMSSPYNPPSLGPTPVPSGANSSGGESKASVPLPGKTP